MDVQNRTEQSFCTLNIMKYCTSLRDEQKVENIFFGLFLYDTWRQKCFLLQVSCINVL